MSIQSTIQLRIDNSLKEKASNALKGMGLDLSSGIKLFLNEIVISETIPFLPSTVKGKRLRHYKLYEKETAWAKKHGKRFTSAKELMDDILR